MKELEKTIKQLNEMKKIHDFEKGYALIDKEDKGMKSKLAEFINVLDEMHDELAIKANGWQGQVELLRIFKLLSDKARQLLAEEQSQKPEATAGLITEIEEYCPIQCENCLKGLREIISNYTPAKEHEPKETIYFRFNPDNSVVAEQEPLAVLADRKGYCKTVLYRTINRGWWVILQDCYEREWTSSPQTSPTNFSLVEAESKARQYLEGLEDKK